MLLQVEPLEGRVVPTSVILGPSKDNTLYQISDGSISNGAGSYFIAGETNGGLIRRGVIAFDIADNIPAGATINSVSLSLHMSQTAGGIATVQLARLTADWGEGTSNADGSPGQGAPATTNDATWVYRFFNTSATWTHTGGDFVTNVSAFTSVGGFGFYTWGSTSQMVADVQGWLNNPGSNFGWIVIGDESQSQTAKRFDSKENSTPADRPMLTIDYTASTSSASTLALSGYPSPVTAGVQGTETVTAKDASGNTATDYRGTVHFSSSDQQAGLPADYQFTAADAGVHAFNVTLKTAGTQSITATDTVTSSITGSQSGITVTPAAAASFNLSGFPSPVTAGVQGSVTVTARDAYGNTATGYTGTVHITSSDPQAARPPDYQFTAADAGVHALNVTLKTAGTQSISATDTGDMTITGAQTGITVNAAGVDHLNVIGPGSATAGAAFDLTVTAQDQYNNTVSGYTGTVHFTSSDAGASFPADYSFTAADNGTHTFAGMTTLILAGNQTITATDTASTSVTGTAAVTVSAAGVNHFDITTAGTVAAGTPFDLIVTARDQYGNTVTGYTGTVHFTTSDQDPQVTLPPDYPFTAADNGTHTFSGMTTLYTPGDQTITVTDTSDSTIFGTVTVTI